MKAEGFPATLRLRRRREFLRVQDHGEKHHTRHFLVFVARRADGGRPPRLGITVTRKVGPAVVRNRIKRLVRESFRRERVDLPTDLDMVWIAKRNAAEVGYAEVADELRGWTRRWRRMTREEGAP